MNWFEYLKKNFIIGLLKGVVAACGILGAIGVTASMSVHDFQLGLSHAVLTGASTFIGVMIPAGKKIAADIIDDGKLDGSYSFPGSTGDTDDDDADDDDDDTDAVTDVKQLVEKAVNDALNNK